MTLTEARSFAISHLNTLYDQREAATICDWVLEHVTGKKKIDRLLEKDALMPGLQFNKLQQIIRELETHRPIQYVLGEAWFAGMLFFVNESVLIPRPETEELVDWVVGEIKNSKSAIKNILDIGTGSGCIPVSIKKKLPAVLVSGIDISEDALAVAKKNAAILGAEINFNQIDFLKEENLSHLPVFDIIISNPPYIKQSEEKTMAKHVLDFEPSIALFVPDEDALLFYRKIAQFAKTHLSAQGAVFVEINEALGKEVAAFYENKGYQVELRKDLQGKDRMMKINLKII